MMNITYRSLTATERDELAIPSERFSPGCLGVITIYGLYLIAIACVVGLVGTSLCWFGISRAVANGCGFLLGTVLATIHFARRRQAENAVLAGYNQRRRAALSGGVVQIVQFNVHRAWSIGDLEDFGPGYLFDVGSDQFVYAATQQFLDFEQAFPRQRVIIEVLPELSTIYSVHAAGDPVPERFESISIGEFGLPDPLISFQIFTHAELSASVVAKIGLTA